MRLDAMAEKDLLLKVSRGDEKAFRELVDHYWWPVYYNVLSLTKSSTTAQEITQDIFLKLWQKKEVLKDVRDFMVYVYVVGKNLVLTALKKKIRESQSIMPEHLAETQQLPDLSLEYKETWRVVMQAIDAMPAKQQQVFRLSRIEGLSNSQIAQKTGLSLPAVKWHIVAGLNTIRIFLASQTGEILFFLFAFTTLVIDRQ